MWIKGNICTPLADLQIDKVIMEISLKVPQEIKNRTCTEIWYCPAVPLLGIYLKETKHTL